MSSLVKSLIVRALLSIPMSGYRTYIINVIMFAAFLAVGLVTGHWDVAGGFMGLAISNIFNRAGTDNTQASVDGIASAVEMLMAGKAQTVDDGK